MQLEMDSIVFHCLRPYLSKYIIDHFTQSSYIEIKVRKVYWYGMYNTYKTLRNECNVSKRAVSVPAE